MSKQRRRRPDLNLPARGGLPAIRIRFADLPPSDITTVNGFRVTTILRTLVDLAGDLPPDEMVRIIGDAVAKKLISRDELINLAIERTDLDAIEEFRTALAEYLSDR